MRQGSVDGGQVEYRCVTAEKHVTPQDADSKTAKTGFVHQITCDVCLVFTGVRREVSLQVLT